MKAKLLVLITALCMLMTFMLTSCDDIMSIIESYFPIDDGFGDDFDDEFGDDFDDEFGDDLDDEYGDDFDDEFGDGDPTDDPTDDPADDPNDDPADDPTDTPTDDENAEAEISTDWYSESENEYIISTEADFNGIGYLSDLYGLDYSGKTIVLENDIVIGKLVKPTEVFRGEFDGNSHKITFSYNGNDAIFSLFGKNEGNIHDLTLDACSVVIDRDAADACVTFIANENYGTISNCDITNSEISVTTIGSVDIASLCGSNYSSIKDCDVECDIVCEISSENAELISYIGGIASRSNTDSEYTASISDCTYSGKGEMISSGELIYFGAIAAEAKSSSIENCETSGEHTITTKSQAGFGTVCASAGYSNYLPSLTMASLVNCKGNLTVDYNGNVINAANQAYLYDFVYLKNDNLDTQFEDNYYYNTLNDSEKGFYKEAYTWMVEAGNYPFVYDYDTMPTLGPIDISKYGLSAEDISELAVILRLDNPEIYYLDLTYRSYSVGEDKFVAFCIADRYIDTYDMEEEKTALEAILEEVAEATRDMSDYEKIRYAYEYVIESTEYDFTYNYVANYSISGALLYSSSVCTGYSYSFKYLCDYLGIDCLVVVSDEMLHAWNIVNLGGVWYYVDVTWADTAEMDFFLQGSDEFMSETPSDDLHYSINEYLTLPEISKTTYAK